MKRVKIMLHPRRCSEQPGGWVRSVGIGVPAGRSGRGELPQPLPVAHSPAAPLLFAQLSRHFRHFLRPLGGLVTGVSRARARLSGSVRPGRIRSGRFLLLAGHPGGRESAGLWCGNAAAVGSGEPGRPGVGPWPALFPVDNKGQIKGPGRAGPAGRAAPSAGH